MIKKLRNKYSQSKFTTNDAKKLGISQRMLCYFVKTKKIQRVAHGTYILTEFDVDTGDWRYQDLAFVTSSYKNAVVCLVSALSYWGLTNEFTRFFWLAFPNNQPRLKNNKIRIYRPRNLDVGIVSVKISGIKIKITSPERSIVDAFKSLDEEMAITSLNMYLAQHHSKINLSKLVKCALVLRETKIFKILTNITIAEIKSYPSLTRKNALDITNALLKLRVEKMNEEKLKTRIISIAKEHKKTFNDIFKTVAFERLLARISASTHYNRLIFKGGLCLKQFIGETRETIDIDFLIKKAITKANTIEKIFKDITKISLDDLFTFSVTSVVLLKKQNNKLPSYRINIKANLGKTKDKIQIDLGTGDVVDEMKLNLEMLKHKEMPLFSPGNIPVLAYPPEFIFSEKIEAIVSLGSFNSRMKDYYDCYMLILKEVMNKKKSFQAINKTFKNRKTSIQKINEPTSDIKKLWRSFCLKVPNAPQKIDEVVNTINNYLVHIGLTFN